MACIHASYSPFSTIKRKFTLAPIPPAVNLGLTLGMIAIIFGILVIVFPDLLQWIVGLNFIIQGLLFFADYLELRKG